MAVQEKINTIERKVNSYHTTDRSRRESNPISEEDLRIDRLKAELMKL